MKTSEPSDTLGMKALRKLRQTTRAVYASFSKEEARSMVHSLEEQKQQISSLKEKIKTADEHSRRLAAQNRSLISGLKAPGDSVEFKKSNFSDFSNDPERKRLESKIDQLQQQINKLSGPAANANLKKLVQQNQTLKNKLGDMKVKLHRHIETTRNYGVVARYINQENVLTANVFKLLSEHKFDVVIGHDILGIGAATSISAHCDVPLYLDVVEEYNLLNRSGDFFRRSLTDSDALLLNSGINALVEAADQWIQIGPEQLTQFKERTGFDSLYLPNFRNPLVENAEHKNKALEVLVNAGVNDKPYICIPNRITNFDEVEPIIKAVLENNLPHHIVHVGAPLSDLVRDSIHSLIGKNSENRFHELGLLDYETYRHIMTQAACCSFLTRETVFNVKYAFPNRLFDAVSSHTPILTGGFVQVGDFVEKNEFGVFIGDEITDEAVSDALVTLVNRESDIKAHMNNLSKTFSWDTVFAQAFGDIPAGANVLILSRKDLRPNQRIKNLKESFIRNDCRVTVIGGHRTDFEVLDDFYTVPLTRILNDEETLFH